MTSSSAHGQRPWAPEDSLAVRYYATSFGRPGDWVQLNGGDYVVYSPDRTRFFVLSGVGDLHTDTSVGRLEVFNVEDVRSAMASAERPQRIVLEYRSHDNRGPILRPRWSPDGALLFAATTDDGTVQIFRLAAGGSRARQITYEETDVVGFEERARSIVYFTKQPVTRFPLSVNRPYQRYPATIADGRDQQIGNLRERALVTAATYVNVHLLHDNRRQSLGFSAHTMFMDGYVSISPNGEWATIVGPAPGRGFDTFLVSLRTRNAVQLTGEIGLAQLPAGPIAAESVTWSEDGQHFSIENDTDSVSLRLDRGQWQRTNETAPTPNTSHAWTETNLHIAVEQSWNQPPRLVARDGARYLVLSEPDPVLANVSVARIAPFDWHLSDGTSAHGGLMLPTVAPPPNGYPLIIQAYGHYPDFFLPDGPYAGTGDAAQSLVARGFAVLQFNAWGGQPPRAPREAELDLYIGAVESAVRLLDEANIVDPTRVGLTGFSRTGFFAHYAITHTTDVIWAAAVVIDSTTHSFVEESTRGVFSENDGNALFWSDPEGWIRSDVTFNANRLRTPALFTRHNDPSNSEPDDVPPEGRATINSLIVNRRPFEYLLFPSGAHGLRRPSERLALTNAVVDWFAFWILGEEDQAPAKSAQYQRWRLLREEWRIQLAWESAGNPAGSRPSADFSIAHALNSAP